MAIDKITSAAITDGTIVTDDIADANVTAAKLASGTVQNQSAFKKHHHQRRYELGSKRNF